MKLLLKKYRAWRNRRLFRKVLWFYMNKSKDIDMAYTNARASFDALLHPEKYY